MGACIKLPYLIELTDKGYLVNGEPKERVSNVLKRTKQCDDYSGVEPYYRDLGIAAAKAIELDLKGTLDESSVDPAVAPRLAAWRAFKAEKHYEPIACELSLYSEELDVCGTLDHYGVLNNEPGILDTKCCQDSKKWWKKQLHFYKRFVVENKLGPVQWLASLRLQKDGAYEFDLVRLDPDNLVDCIMGLYRNELLEDKRRK